MNVGSWPGAGFFGRELKKDALRSWLEEENGSMGRLLICDVMERRRCVSEMLGTELMRWPWLWSVVRLGPCWQDMPMAGPTYRWSAEHARLALILPHVTLATRLTAVFGHRLVSHAMRFCVWQWLLSSRVRKLDRRLCSISCCSQRSVDPQEALGGCGVGASAAIGWNAERDL